MLENFFRSNHFARILALFLALVLWLSVEGDDITHPTPSRESFEEVSLVTLDLGDGLVVENMPSNVNVTLEGSEEAIEDITSRDLLAFVDLQGKEPGSYTLPVKVQPPSQLEVVSQSPSSVNVHVETMDSRTFALEVAMLGRDPSSEVQASLTPNEVTLQGASSTLESVETVMVYADVRRLNQKKTHEVVSSPQPLDDEREPVEGLSVSPSEIEIVLELLEEEELDEDELDEEENENG